MTTLSPAHSKFAWNLTARNLRSWREAAFTAHESSPAEHPVRVSAVQVREPRQCE